MNSNRTVEYNFGTYEILVLQSGVRSVFVQLYSMPLRVFLFFVVCAAIMEGLTLCYLVSLFVYGCRGAICNRLHLPLLAEYRNVLSTTEYGNVA